MKTKVVGADTVGEAVGGLLTRNGGDVTLLYVV